MSADLRISTETSTDSITVNGSRIRSKGASQARPNARTTTPRRSTPQKHATTNRETAPQANTEIPAPPELNPRLVHWLTYPTDQTMREAIRRHTLTGIARERADPAREAMGVRAGEEAAAAARVQAARVGGSREKWVGRRRVGGGA